MKQRMWTEKVDTRRRLVAFLTSLLLLISMTVVVSADDQDDLDKLEQEQEQAETEMAALANDIESAQAELDALNEQVYQTMAQIEETEAQIAQKEADIKATLASISSQESSLGQRLRAMYKNGSVGFLDVILNSKDLSDFLSNVSMVQEIYKSDQATLDELEAQHDKLVEEQKQLEETKAELEQTKAVLDEQQAEAQQKTDALQAQKDELQAYIDQLEADSEALRSQIWAAQSGYSGPEYYSGGTLGWPCAGGVITSYYGSRIHPITGYETFHTGIDIGLDYGTPIYAAESGTVVLASWYGGYGYAVVIQHGSTLSTLYGHNSTLLVTPGQTVTRGQTIALAGSTGNSTGPHCHFEVWNGSNEWATLNPLDYL